MGCFFALDARIVPDEIYLPRGIKGENSVNVNAATMLPSTPSVYVSVKPDSFLTSLSPRLRDVRCARGDPLKSSCRIFSFAAFFFPGAASLRLVLILRFQLGALFYIFLLSWVEQR